MLVRSMLVRRTQLAVLLLVAPTLWPLATGCAASVRGPGPTTGASIPHSAHGAPPTLQEAQAALEGGAGPRAVVAYSRLARHSRPGGEGEVDPQQRIQILGGLARAQIDVGDFESARSTLAGLLAEVPEHADAADTWARLGAVQAELGEWAQSAHSLDEAYQRLDQAALVSARIELLARRAYALFSDGAYESCSAVLDQAEALYAKEEQAPTERFSTFYFVGMMRFYRAALLHTQFREVQVELPEARMTAAFSKKLELLTAAQAGYNDTIRVKHVYWVSAAGFQLGTLFEEFYDDLMHAPVPDWLDDGQKQTYYEELKAQLRPVVNKAIWVFEKNLESARRLGYENPFVEQTRDALARLQAVLLDSDAKLGSPHPRLVESSFAGLARGETDDEQSAIGPLDRKLHLPAMTPL